VQVVNTVVKKHLPKINHPTVKPISLMRYLCRLVTPLTGIILDPFMGSGTTLLAAYDEGFNCIGIEKDSQYAKIAEARLKAHIAQLKLELIYNEIY
jgi:DNA modification methylase